MRIVPIEVDLSRLLSGQAPYFVRWKDGRVISRRYFMHRWDAQKFADNLTTKQKPR